MCRNCLAERFKESRGGVGMIGSAGAERRPYSDRKDFLLHCITFLLHCGTVQCVGVWGVLVELVERIIYTCGSM